MKIKKVLAMCLISAMVWGPSQGAARTRAKAQSA